MRKKILILATLIISICLSVCVDAATKRSLRIGDRVNSSSSGSMLFIDGNKKLGQDDTNLYWDSINKRLGLGTNTPTELLDLDSDSLRIRVSKTPSSSNSTGTQGQIAWDANYIYVCIATNTWVRSILSTWATDEFILLEIGDLVLTESGFNILKEPFAAVTAEYALLETGDFILLESGDNMILE